MATVYRLIDAGRQYLDDNGDPLSGGQLFTYVAGSSTKKTTYQESSGTTPHANPIVLDAAGRLPAPVWGTTGPYKLVLAPSTDTDPPASPEWTEDDVSGINDTASSSIDQWVASGFTPTYVSATSLTVVGDQTSILHLGRRIKTTNNGGTRYSRITGASYSAPNTTLDIVNDSGSLDAGLSELSYGLLSASNPSIPNLTAAVGGTWVAIETQTASASPTLDFDSSINNNYNHYVLVLKGLVPATDNVQLLARIATAGPTWQAGAAAYQWGGTIVGTGGSGTSDGSGSGGPTTAMCINGSATTKVGSAAGEGIDAVIEFFVPSSTTQRKRFTWRGVYTSAAGTDVSCQGGGSYGSTAAIVGVRLLFSDDNIASGEATLYGVRK